MKSWRANGFVLPSNIGLRLSEIDRTGWEYCSNAKERHEVMTGDGRLSDESIKCTINSSVPDFELLCSLVVGIPIITTESFEPTGKPLH